MTSYETLKQNLTEAPLTWLVTGAAGFIGSNLVLALLRCGQRVVGIDNLLTGSLSNLEEVKGLISDEQWSQFQWIQGDICDVDMVRAAINGVDVVLHQAALGSVPRSIAHPEQTNHHNVTGFLTILNEAKNAGVRRFVYASSSSVYGDHPGLPKVEDCVGEPLSPYAVSKKVNEMYARVFSKCYGIQCVGLRYFNVFGARQSPNGPYAAVIPKWIDAMLKCESVIINGDGETSRDFCFIENVVQANLLAATIEHDSLGGEVFNIAAGGRTTLNQLYEMLKMRLCNENPELLDKHPVYKDFRPGDIRHSNADITKAKKMLGYEPTHRIDDGLDAALEWYLANRG